VNTAPPFAERAASIRSAPHAGLTAAFASHYDDLVAHVRRHIAHRGGDRATAHDVVHDVCLELITTPPQQVIHAPLAFLREVVARRAIDRYRVESGRRAWVESSDELPECCDEGAAGRDPECIACGRQRLKILAGAIDALPPRCRDVFIMHKIHELPQREVADQLGIALKTVEKHLRLGVLACSKAMLAAA
jgi:RNA polymerase sigma factor (sigma-70 family)